MALANAIHGRHVPQTSSQPGGCWTEWYSSTCWEPRTGCEYPRDLLRLADQLGRGHSIQSRSPRGLQNVKVSHDSRNFQSVVLFTRAGCGEEQIADLQDTLGTSGTGSDDGTGVAL